MKKYGFYIIFVICLIFAGIGILEVNADEFKFLVHVEPAVVEAAGENVKLKFVVSSGNNYITNCAFDVYPSSESGITFEKDEAVNGWVIDRISKTGYVLESIDGVNDGVIMNSVYKVSNSSSITVSNVKCSTADDTEFKVEDDIVVDVIANITLVEIE